MSFASTSFRSMSFRGSLALLIVGLSVVACSAPEPASPPNVLFIAVDDLRPQIATYGKDFMHTPNIDRLAGRGVLFERSYVMVPTCGASRASLMSGVRPSPNRFVNYLAWAERDAPGAVTINSQFKNSGYTTISLGKVFHHPEDNVAGWSEPPWRSKIDDYKDAAVQEAARAEHLRNFPEHTGVRRMAYEAGDADDEEYRDGETASRAIDYLQDFSGDPEQPFFLAVGFHKPHLPFLSPQKYWDLYDFEEIDIPDNYGPPEGAPEVALHNSGELRNYAGIPQEGPVDRETARKLIHGYYASVSFIDAQVGRLLDSLDELGLDENTIIVLWGDHGWQLGEHGMWNKHSCFETSMHAPLIIVAPQAEGVEPGTRVSALTEFIDIYPTLTELAGIPAPEHLEGTSAVPLMVDPSAPWKDYAVGRYRSGDTIRSDRHRYSEYADDEGDVHARMLYDHQVDPDENVNVAEEAEKGVDVSELSVELNGRKGRDDPASDGE